MSKGKIPKRTRQSLRVVRALIRAVQRLDDLLQQLEKLIEDGAFGSEVRPPRKRPPLKPVDVLITSRNADGSFALTIDDHLPFNLPALLKDLLLTLARDKGAGKDGLVEWKSYKDIVATVRTLQGKEDFDKGALRQDVYRLRATFELHGLNRDLIQTDRPSGSYRFAIRSRNPPLVVSDSS